MKTTITEENMELILTTNNIDNDNFVELILTESTDDEDGTPKEKQLTNDNFIDVSLIELAAALDGFLDLKRRRDERERASEK